MVDHIHAFQQLISQLLQDWGAFEIRAIARKGESGDWVLNCLRVTLGRSDDFSLSKAELPDLQDLLIHYEVKPTRDLTRFLKSLGEGDLHLGKKHIDLRRPKTSPPEPSFYVRMMDRRSSRSEFGLDFMCVVLRGGDSVTNRLPREDLDTIDARLRASDPPWDGLPDLRENFVGIDQESAVRRDWANVEVIAPIGVNLSRTELEGDTVTVRVGTRGNLRGGRIAVSLVARLSDGSISRISCSFEENVETKGGLRARFDLPSPLVQGTLSLTYQDMDADRLELYGRIDPSETPRLGVLEEFVGGADALIRGLEEAKGSRLEDWVALLFHVLGFSVVRYGFLSGEIPDVLAFPESDRWFLVVECTAREPDLGGKLTKFSTRTKELSRLTGLHAYPVLVSGLDRDLLNRTDLEKAAKELIAIVSVDELATLVQLALRGDDTAKIRSYLESLIPRQGGEYPYWPK